MSESPKEPDSGEYPPGWVPGETKPSRGSREGNAKWTIPLAVLAVVAVVVTGVLIFTGDGDAPATDTSARPATSSSAAPPADPTVIASAADVGPVGIITSDATCESWREVQSTMDSAQSNGWDERNPAVPGAAWTPAQRQQYEQVGAAMRTTSDKAVSLARQTPNRVMRELYEAYTAYGRAYASALADYQPAQDFLANAAIAALQSISEICAAADDGSALSRGPAVPPAAPPTAPAPPADPANPERFLPQSGPTCARWVPAEAALAAQTQAWVDLDSDVPPAQWTPGQRALLSGAGAAFSQSSATLESDGRVSGNPVFEDFATTAAQYFRAFAAAVPTYAAADRNLGMVGLRLDTLISTACQAAATP